jgi:hypothetical protein
MVPNLQHLDVQKDVPSQSTESGTAAFDATILTPTSTLLALGAELKAYLEQPGNVSVGDFAAVVERLHGEFKLLCGEPDLMPKQDDDYADLFVDRQSRELSPSDIGMIESILNDIG